MTVRKAIVTGSDSGIGKATAVALADSGCDVGITWYEDEEGALETASEVGSTGRRAVVRHLDAADLDRAPSVLEEMIGDLGGLHVFVNNAGTGHSEPFLEHDLKAWQHVIDVDLTGPFLLAQTAARHMASWGGGRIVNVTSVHEHIPLKTSAAYCAAKGGLGLLTKVMALELADKGITVNSVAPGEISTPMTGQEDVDPGTQERPGIPLGRPGDAREVAALIAWLTSEAASYTTGVSYVIDGGMLLMPAEANKRG